MDIKTAKLLLLSATEAIRHAHFEEALKMLSAFQVGDPLYAMHLQLRGMALHAIGRPHDAVEQLRLTLHDEACSPGLIASLLKAATAAGMTDEKLFAECITKLTSYPESTISPMLSPVLDAVSFGTASTFEWNTLTYRCIVLPLLHWCLANDSLDDALFLESQIYPYVQQRETESHYRECFMAWTDAMYAAGQRHSQGSSRLYNHGGGIRVAFFVEKLISLIHVQAVLEMLHGFRKTGHSGIAVSLYVFARKIDKEILDRFRELEVPVILLGEEYPEAPDKRFTRLQHFARRLSEDKIDVLVWVSLALMMPLAFGMRIAPVQIWLSVKYHSIECAGIDRYMTRMGFSRKRLINGRLWDNIPPAMDDWPNTPAYQAMARPVREKFAGQLILGTFGREEKLTDPRFLAAITRVLSENPNTAFLYTGRRNHPIIADALTGNAAFSDRVHYIGWVDTRLYANVVDIFLDSFPFPCGLTLFEAMSVGVPIVMRETIESRETGLPGHILPIMERIEGTDEERADLYDIFGGEDLPWLLIAHSDDEYVEIASRVIADTDFRHQAGNACRRFIDTYMTGTERAGQIFADHVRHAVAERRSLHSQNHTRQ